MGQRYSKIKYMLLGAIITVLASQSIVPTAASMVGKTINVYTGISVYVDDQEIIPTDVTGVMELRVEFDPYYATRVFGTSRYVAELDDVGLWT